MRHEHVVLYTDARVDECSSVIDGWKEELEEIISKFKAECIIKTTMIGTRGGLSPYAKEMLNPEGRASDPAVMFILNTAFMEGDEVYAAGELEKQLIEIGMKKIYDTIQ